VIGTFSESTPVDSWPWPKSRPAAAPCGEVRFELTEPPMLASFWGFARERYRAEVVPPDDACSGVAP
jgi:hypothetical protein